MPLNKDVKSIAVIGPNAADASNLFGDYAPSVVLQHVGTILDGIKAKVSPATRVLYVKGCGVNDQDKSGFAKAVEAAKNASVAVVVVGEQARREGEHNLPPPTDGEGYDVATLDLTGVQEDLVRAVHATGTPTILVLINGRPLSVRWEADHVPAILEAWEPGERGGEAVADALFGDYNPSGRLAITVPRSVGQLPSYYNYKPSKSYWINGGWTHDRGYVDMPGTPLYPFGYGLSYTHFQYSNLRIDPAQIHTEGNAQVSVDVENSGQRAWGGNRSALYPRTLHSGINSCEATPRFSEGRPRAGPEEDREFHVDPGRSEITRPRHAMGRRSGDVRHHDREVFGGRDVERNARSKRIWPTIRLGSETVKRPY